MRDIVETITRGPDFNRLPDNTYNLAMGEEISGRSLAALTQGVLGSYGFRLKYRCVDFAAPGYVRESTLDTSRITDLYGWKPRYGYREMIESITEYYLRGGSIEPPSWDKI